MQKSESIDQLAAALSKAQSEIKGAVKDSENPFFRSKYADLESVWEAIRVPFTKNGLAVAQATQETEKGTVLETILMHVSGQWISGTLQIKSMKEDPQSKGSALSYSRRYALSAMAGVTSVDDDAESAMGRKHYDSAGTSSKNTQNANIRIDGRREGDGAAATVLDSPESRVSEQEAGTHSARDPINVAQIGREKLKGGYFNEVTIESAWKIATKKAQKLAEDLINKAKEQKLSDQQIKFLDYGIVTGYFKQDVTNDQINPN